MPWSCPKFRPLSSMICLFVLIAFAKTGFGQDGNADPWLTRPVDGRTFQTYLQFFAYDHDVPFDLQLIDAADEDGLRREHISFESTPGVRVYANYYQPVSMASQSLPAIVLLHGGTPAGKRSAAVRMLAALLARDGWGVLAIDMQYFGERSTDLLTTFTEKEKHERLYNQKSLFLAWTTQTVKDVSRSFDFLVKHRNADPKRIGLVGFSRGAQVATIAGGADNRLAAVVLLHGGHYDAFERGHLPAACPANYIGRISPRPLLTINGTHDADYVRETSVLPLHRLAREPKRHIWADTGHAVLREEDLAAMVHWLRENLK